MSVTTRTSHSAQSHGYNDTLPTVDCPCGKSGKHTHNAGHEPGKNDRTGGRTTEGQKQPHAAK